MILKAFFLSDYFIWFSELFSCLFSFYQYIIFYIQDGSDSSEPAAYDPLRKKRKKKVFRLETSSSSGNDESDDNDLYIPRKPTRKQFFIQVSNAFI